MTRFRRFSADNAAAYQNLQGSDDPFDAIFVHVVEIPDPSYVEKPNFFNSTTPSVSAMKKLRLITWLGEQRLVDQVDYEVRVSGEGKLIYAFKDPKVAMMFKLAWYE